MAKRIKLYGPSFQANYVSFFTDQLNEIQFTPHTVTEDWKLLWKHIGEACSRQIELTKRQIEMDTVVSSAAIIGLGDSFNLCNLLPADISDVSIFDPIEMARNQAEEFITHRRHCDFSLFDVLPISWNMKQRKRNLVLSGFATNYALSNVNMARTFANNINASLEPGGLVCLLTFNRKVLLNESSEDEKTNDSLTVKKDNGFNIYSNEYQFAGLNHVAAVPTVDMREESIDKSLADFDRVMFNQDLVNVVSVGVGALLHEHKLLSRRIPQPLREWAGLLQLSIYSHRQPVSRLDQPSVIQPEPVEVTVQEVIEPEVITNPFWEL